MTPAGKLLESKAITKFTETLRLSTLNINTMTRGKWGKVSL